MRRWTIPILLVTLLASCGDGGNEGGRTAHTGLGRGHFRGNSIGDALEQVLKREPIDSVVFSEPDQVVYSIRTDSVALQVSYEFEDDTLHTIQSDWFFAEDGMRVRMQEQLRDDFNLRFAMQESEGDFEVWQAVRGDGTMIEFTLADVSTEYGRPVLSLTVYRFE